MVIRSPSIVLNSLLHSCSEPHGSWKGHGVTESELVLRLRAAGSVFAEAEATLLLAEAADPAELETMAARRVEGEPLEQILGWAEFDGRRFLVEPGVFVPRHRSEFLVRRAAELGNPGAVILDLCCGIGALGLAVQARLGAAELHSADLDPAEVRCARRNVGPDGHVYEGDLYAPLPDSLRGRVDLLIANAPYVPRGDLRLMPAEAREHENPVALDGGGDGLAVHRRVIADAPAWLAPGGRMLIELSSEQATVAASLMGAAGLHAEIVTDADDDEDGDDTTVVIGTA
jgi:release factor glutamine methyltransferase